jgi:hypothetical protein
LWPCAYRQVWPLKFAAASEVLSEGLHTLLVDSDWSFVSSPYPLLDGLNDFDAFGILDQKAEGAQLMNVGLLFLRSTAVMKDLCWRVANRTAVAWDQTTFNEEISHSSASCCYANDQLSGIVKKRDAVHNLKKEHGITSKKNKTWTVISECEDQRLYYALAPPTGSHVYPSWSPHSFNMAVRVSSKCAATACPSRGPLNPRHPPAHEKDFVQAAAKGAQPSADLAYRVASMASFVGDQGGPLQLLLKEKVNVSNSIHLNELQMRWPPKKMDEFAAIIYREHNLQTVQIREELQNKWSNTTLIGDVDVWDLLQLLHFTVDHSDSLLHYTSQFIHILQVYNGIRRSTFPESQFDPMFKSDLLVAALLHDIGKLLALVGQERDAYVDCMNRVIPHSLNVDSQAKGLANMKIQWNHDEYGYQKLAAVRPRLPKRVLASVRYHSLRELTGKPSGRPSRAWGGYDVTPTQVEAFNGQLTTADRETIRFVMKMRYYDQATKIRTDEIPAVDVAGIKDLLKRYFPSGKIHW